MRFRNLAGKAQSPLANPDADFYRCADSNLRAYPNTALKESLPDPPVKEYSIKSLYEASGYDVLGWVISVQSVA